MKKFAPFAALYAAYFLIAIVITYPLITHLQTEVIGHPFGDAYEYIGLSWWVKTALQTGHDPFFHNLLLYPDGLPAPLLWSIPLQSFPTAILAFVMPLSAAFNLSALLTLALNGLSMFALVRHLMQTNGANQTSLRGVPTTGWMQPASYAAFLSGLVGMAYPTFQGQLGAAHIGLLSLWGVPLLVLALLKLRDTDHPVRGIAIAAALFPISLWGNMTLIVYLVAPLCLLLLTWAFVVARSARDSNPQVLETQKSAKADSEPVSMGLHPSLAEWLQPSANWLLRLMFALALGAAIWMVFALPTLLDTSGSSPLQADGDVRYSAPLVGIVAPSFYHPLFTSLEYSRRALGVEPFENASYVGLIAAALCVIGLIRQRAARRWLPLAIITWIFSLGALLKIDAEPIIRIFDGIATPVSLPWAIFQDLPGLGFARTPARFNFAVGFAVAVMAGYGAATLLKFISHPRHSVRVDTEQRGARGKRVYQLASIMVTLVLAAEILFEYQFWFPLPTTPGVVPEEIRNLGNRGDIRAVFDIPYWHPLVSKEAMFLQTGHGLPILTGQVARATPIDPAKASLLQGTFDPALLDASGVDAIIVHHEWEDPASPFAPALNDCCGAPVYEDAQYAVYLVPTYEGDSPGFTQITPTDITTTNPVSLYFYAPAPGGALLNASLAADGRDVTATLDDADEPLMRWTINGAADAALWVEFGAGFHTLTLALNPPCVTPPLPSLTCATLTVEGLTFEP